MATNLNRRNVIKFVGLGASAGALPVWVDKNRSIIRLHDLKADPFEEKNLLDSTDDAHKAAIKKFQTVIDALPEKDARPKYDPRKANSWDMVFGKSGKSKKRGKE
jgi:hypothetical protein